jgi:hypothetical protein
MILRPYRVQALKVVETYIEAFDLQAAAVQAQYECTRDGVRLMGVYDVELHPLNGGVAPVTPVPERQDYMRPEFLSFDVDGH